MGSEFEAGYDAYERLRKDRFVLIDTEALEDAVIHGAGGDVAAECIRDDAFYDGKGSALAMRGILGSILPRGIRPLHDGSVRAQPVSLGPSSNRVVNWAGRFLSMIHELHKVGYQRLRICAGWSPDRSEWRCNVVTVDNVCEDGWTPVVWGRGNAYATGEGKSWFGWDDAENDDARRLATKFIERFPETAKSALGQDWLYAGWFSAILGAADNGVLPAFYGGYDLGAPEPRTPLPPPPVGMAFAEYFSNEQGTSLVANEELRIDALPSTDAGYESLWPFCLTYDGYRNGQRTIDDCFAIADKISRDGFKTASLDQLRTAAFIHQRSIRNNEESGMPPDPSSVKLIRAVVEEIRRRLSSGDDIRRN